MTPPARPASGPGLAGILADREARTAIRMKLTQGWSGRSVAVVQLCLVVPGPIKSDKEIDLAVDLGARSWEDRAAALGLTLLHGEARLGPAGPCRFWVVEADPREIKSLIIGLEESCGLGRLWDFDVYDEEGLHIGRAQLGVPPRRCFVCGEVAAICSGRRLHDPLLVEGRFRELLRHGIAERHSREADLGRQESIDAS